MKNRSTLTPDAKHVLIDKGTEKPFSGKYIDVKLNGTYLCHGCGTALFRADSQFTSSCGWPSFDDDIATNVTRKQDADGRRTEIICSRCGGHLGHVFEGENHTNKNTRYCVNSLSVDFVENETVNQTEEAIFAAGCFWGVQSLFDKLDGVLLTEVGYTGGDTEYPSYEEVCKKRSGHYEAMRVIYNPEKINYQAIVKYFFEIHDPTQASGQGPDIGPQYKSAIFYYDEQQKKIADEVINELIDNGVEVVTEVKEAAVFWPAEDYHQSYYDKTGKTPYCHVYTKRFD